MGLILDARCDACGYARDGLKLGATHAQIAAHDRSHHEVFGAPCCHEVQSVLVVLGEPWPEARCDRCGQPVTLVQERRYRISTMKGEMLAGHPCPRCAEKRLRFDRAGTFI